ncbi:MAG TPA: acyl-CoA dehydrogenase [Acidimicrobiia bacterium]|jgi:alkylation response protein AidB-like acyl-CoA dehydrogenase|nr:acyl-CoA/acyl-ACP dehydrogenase [Acidimicrobiales bacterium]HBL07554.1 acyl-CoA dehydrogenase [Acidimicrobiaceae bacterium]HIM65356.1 acyl-CoA dehydrogenase [Acidimicrobiia bacterium]HIM85290.1 acyl-CoA dehydrogenase [Acidimicrobiia bacterium]
MHFAFSDEQELFRDTVRDILANACPPAAVRASWDDPTGGVPGLWETLAATGLMGLLVPGDRGGLGMDDTDLVLILEELGRAACPDPVAEHVAVAAPVVAAHAPPAMADEWLGRAAAGGAVLTAGSPVDDFVPAAERADLLLLCAGGEVHAVPTAEVTCTPQESVDRARRLARVDWTPTPSTLVSDDPAVVDEVLDRGALAAAAQAVGVGRRLLDMTVAHVSEREQFGRPVGANQAVKHHCADVAIALEFAGPLVQVAAWAMAAGAGTGAMGGDEAGTVSTDVSMAKSAASDAVDLACRAALQCHGAIGYTIEHDLQLWLKRGWALAASWGDAAHHRRRVAGSLGLLA